MTKTQTWLRAQLRRSDRFVIENGEEVTFYEYEIDFTNALLDLLGNNETVTLTSKKKGDQVYVTLL